LSEAMKIMKPNFKMLLIITKELFT